MTRLYEARCNDGIESPMLLVVADNCHDARKQAAETFSGMMDFDTWFECVRATTTTLVRDKNGKPVCIADPDLPPGVYDGSDEIAWLRLGYALDNEGYGWYHDPEEAARQLKGRRSK